MNSHDQMVKHVGDTISGVAIVASLMSWLPPIAALLGIVWYLMQMYDWVNKRLVRKKTYTRRATDRA